MQAPRLISETRMWGLYGKELLKRIFQLPGEKTSDFYVFRGTTNPVIIFPLTSDNKVIAVRQFRYGANDFVLELPGGVLRTEETLEETLKRELLEETGYQCGQIVMLGENTIWFEPAALTHSFFAYIALDCEKQADPLPEETEIMETVLTPLQDWVSLIGREVRDSKSITTTFLALRYLMAR